MTPITDETGRAHDASGRSRTPAPPRPRTPADAEPPRPPFGVRSRVANGRGGRTSVITLCGELDVAVTYAVARALAYAFDHVGPRIVLDMADVSFADTSGLAAVVEFARRTRECGGQIVLVGANPQVVRLLEAAGRHLAVRPTVSGALLSPAPE
jgi:anti-anti-sigma factor